MLEKTTIIAKGEEACKLFDCILAYKKIAGAVENPENIEANNITIEALPEAETATVEQKV